MQVVPVEGLPEITERSDLPALIIAALRVVAWPDGSEGVRSGDVVVVSSKIISKHEGQWAEDRDEAVAADTVRVVADPRRSADRGEPLGHRDGLGRGGPLEHPPDAATAPRP